MISNYSVPQQLGSSSARDIFPARRQLYHPVALSTVTIIVSRLLAESGMSVTKSMEISLHLVSGIWVDVRFPLAKVWSDFAI